MTLKRLFDVASSAGALAVLAIPMLVVAIAVKTTSRGPVLYWSPRVGRDNRIFNMPKFRTMKVGTPAVATHLLSDPDAWLTPVGKFLRRTSLDELPQLLTVLAGDMTIVGPRPALYNQDDLISMRTTSGVHRLTPGLTGWAQVNGRDNLTVPEKVDLDHFYLRNASFVLDLQIIMKTVAMVFRCEGVTH